VVLHFKGSFPFTGVEPQTDYNRNLSRATVFGLLNFYGM
jgi:hypothetical protein